MFQVIPAAPREQPDRLFAKEGCKAGSLALSRVPREGPDNGPKAVCRRYHPQAPRGKGHIRNHRGTEQGQVFQSDVQLVWQKGV